MRPIAIIGFGGHAKVVSSALLSLGRTIVSYTCLEPNVQENRFTQLPLYTDEELLRKFSSDQIEVVLGLGSIKPNLANSLMRKLFKSLGHELVPLKSQPLSSSTGMTDSNVFAYPKRFS